LQKIDLNTQIRFLKGVGERRARVFEKIGIKKVLDLIHFKPKKYVDRRIITRIKDLKDGKEEIVYGKVFTKGVRKISKEKEFFIVIIKDETGWMELVFVNTPYFVKSFKIGDEVIACGKVTEFKGIKQIFHPEFEVLDKKRSDLIHAGKIVPIYPQISLQTGKSKLILRPKFIRNLIYEVLEIVEEKIPEKLPEYIRKAHGLLETKKAIHYMHFPPSFEAAEIAQKTLIFQEFFYYFIHLLLYKYQKLKAPSIKVRHELTKNFISSLPFELTKEQKRVIREIEVDMAKEIPMRRLLQGEVGSGKTIVALYASLIAIENGFQVAFMAPTEILAEQHFLVTKNFFKNLNVRFEILKGKLKGEIKKRIIDDLKDGKIDLLIGTHSLIEENVEFKNLGLVIIDEQHKFGVAQRAKLVKKGRFPHLLIMTATPIPRTLALALYGDLEISTLKELPYGKRNVKTIIVKNSRRKEFYSRLFEKILKDNEKVYVVSRIIEKSEKLEIKACEEIFEEIKRNAPEGIKIEILHSKVPPQKRSEIMEKFKNGEINILVSTQIVEVGIDVKDARIMVIEGAEMFGLSQLHQLRGRIGRSGDESYCFLIVPDDLEGEAKERINSFLRFDDGFILSEIDLRIRGPGEFLGLRQHGHLNFKMGDIIKNKDILLKAKRQAEAVLEKDPNLSLPENKIILSNIYEEDKIFLTSIG
jgi:ATP-dependent DNA helicase RecG